MKIFNIIGVTFLVIALTIVTQIGGLLFILSIPLFRIIDHKTQKRLIRNFSKSLIFIGLYLLTTIAIIPLIAGQFGRIPLPIFSNDNLKPLSIITCILNRHYVSLDLLTSVETVAKKMNQNHPGTVIAYLDANFPFFDNFPLLPHLSHNDGNKLDLAFFYIDSNTKKPLNIDAPSFIGYGVYEKPLAGETDKPSECANRGYWQYSFLQYLVPQWNKDEMVFDQRRTKDLIQLLVRENSISKIFIEPRLKKRMNLLYEKVRFHGCKAVRHDDLIHIQLK